MFITLSIRTRVAGELLSYVSVPQLSLSCWFLLQNSNFYPETPCSWLNKSDNEQIRQNSVNFGPKCSPEVQNVPPPMVAVAAAFRDSVPEPTRVHTEGGWPQKHYQQS